MATVALTLLFALYLFIQPPHAATPTDVHVTVEVAYPTPVPTLDVEGWERDHPETMSAVHAKCVELWGDDSPACKP